jgi:hypothetical protein
MFYCDLLSLVYNFIVKRKENIHKLTFCGFVMREKPLLLFVPLCAKFSKALFAAQTMLVSSVFVAPDLSVSVR